MKKSFNILFSLFAGISFICSLSLYADVDTNEIPPASTPILKVIEQIPKNISGISSIEYENGKWKIETVNESKNISSPNADQTGKFIESKYILNMATKELEPVGQPEPDNDEHLPPNFTSLTGALNAVLKIDFEANICSAEFDDGSWEVKALTNKVNTQSPDTQNANTSNQNVNNLKQIMKYTVNPVNSVITKSVIDD